MGDNKLLAEAKTAAYTRRALAMRKHYGMKWSRRESIEFVQRLLLASTQEGIDDVDLRVLVRLFNRELIGRRYNEQASEQQEGSDA